MKLDKIAVGMKVEAKAFTATWLPARVIEFDKDRAWVETTWPDGLITTGRRTLDELRKVPNG